ncbi:unnamed protein product, partial [Ilex paraguariensis]
PSCSIALCPVTELILSSRSIAERHNGYKTKKAFYDYSEKEFCSSIRRKEERLLSVSLTRARQKDVFGELFQLGVIVFTRLSHGIIADSPTDSPTIATPTLYAAAASHLHSSIANDLSFYAF